MQRKLTAILSADVVGYSGLMEADETGTLERLKTNRSTIFDPRVSEHGGRVFKLLGDGALVEFSSVVAAVSCALAIQEATEKAAQNVSEAKRVHYRIGVNLGDIIIDGDDIYGDGVNVAARLQTLAPAGGVALSKMVRDNVEGKLPCVFEDKGEHRVKNIERPVHVFFAHAADIAGGAPMGTRRQPLWHRLKKKAGTPRLFLVVAALLILLVAITAIIVWSFGLERDNGAGDLKNVVAVLPFDNVGEDSAFYLSEGLSDELRNALMHVRNLHVLAPASSRAFRAAPLEMAKIAEHLKVGQLIEGSFRREGGQLHVSVQIVNSATGFQTWSQDFERPAKDLVPLQQEVAIAVAIALTGRADASRELQSPPSTNLSAYDALLLAQNYYQEVRNAQVVDKVKLGKAIEFFRVAVWADPKSAVAHSRLAAALLYDEKADDAEVEIKQAVALNPNLSEVQYTLGLYYSARSMPGVGKAWERAVALNPNNVDALFDLARWEWNYSPEPLKSSAELYLRALELDPLSLQRYSGLGYFFAVTGQRDKVLALTKEIATRFPNPPGLQAIGEILEPIGDIDLAIVSVRKALALAPNDANIKAQLAELYAEIGDFKTARHYVPTPDLAQLYWQRDYKKLIDLAEEVVLDHPEQSQIWYLLGFAYAVDGQYENAVRVLKIAGLPGHGEGESHVASDHVAMLTLAAALQKTGAPDEARADADFVAKVGRRFADTGADQGAWSHTLLSCALAILGKDDEAMTALSHVNDKPALPRLPDLKDLLCFKRFADDQRYVSVIRTVEKRQADLRRRVAALHL